MSKEYYEKRSIFKKFHERSKSVVQKMTESLGDKQKQRNFSSLQKDVNPKVRKSLNLSSFKRNFYLKRKKGKRTSVFKHKRFNKNLGSNIKKIISKRK